MSNLAQAWGMPAHRLYLKYGFEEGPSFNGFVEDPNSVLMALELQRALEEKLSYP